MGRIGEAVEKHYKTRAYNPEFINAMRELMADALSDQDRAQRILQKQIRDQLQSLDISEENLLDLMAEPDLPKAKIKSRLLEITREREILQDQLRSVTLELSDGARYLDTVLTLLANPYELYQVATDEVRRRLNQAIFDRLFISDETHTGAIMHEPHGALFAAQAAHVATRAGLPSDTVSAAFNTGL